MKNKVNNIVNNFFKKYEENTCVYPKEHVIEIATNCVSLSNVWLERLKELKNVSLEVLLFNKEGVVCETLHGIDGDNLPFTMLDILVNKNQQYSKMVINQFSYKNGVKVSNLVSELEIS